MSRSYDRTNSRWRIGTASINLTIENTESNAFKNDLLHMKKKSLRNGVWFKALSKIERGIIDLTVRYVERIRSHLLIDVLQRILKKLSEAVNHPFVWRVEQIGRPLAKCASEVALSWNVKQAVSWKDDVSYIRCLGLNYLSSHVSRDYVG